MIANNFKSIPSSQVSGNEFKDVIRWLTASVSPAHKDKYLEVVEDGASFIESYAEKAVGSAHIRRDLYESARILSSMATIALYVWRVRRNASQQEMMEYFLLTPFSVLLEIGISAYETACGEITHTESVFGGDPNNQAIKHNGTRRTDFVKNFFLAFPLAERIAEDRRTLQRIALAFGMSGLEGKRVLRDLERFLLDVNDTDVLVTIVASLMVWAAKFPERKAWEIFYADGMLRLLRELYFSAQDTSRQSEPLLELSPLTQISVEHLTETDLKLVRGALNNARDELRRLLDCPNDLRAILACTSTGKGDAIRQFRKVFFDPRGLTQHDPTRCMGMKTWDMKTVARPLWVAFLEMASDMPPADNDRHDTMKELLKVAAQKASSGNLRWETVESFVLTEAPWNLHAREECRAVISLLKAAIASMVHRGVSEDVVHETLFDLENAELTEGESC